MLRQSIMTQRERVIHDAFVAMGLGTEEDRLRFLSLTAFEQSSPQREGYFVRISLTSDNASTQPPSPEGTPDAELA